MSNFHFYYFSFSFFFTLFTLRLFNSKGNKRFIQDKEGRERERENAQVVGVYTKKKENKTKMNE